MKRFFHRYSRYLFYLPIAGIVALIGFVIGERRAVHNHVGHTPDEIARDHPKIQAVPALALPVETAAPELQPQAEEEPVEPKEVRPLAWAGILVLLIPFAIAVIAIIVSSGYHLNSGAVQAVPEGDPARGRAEMAAYGCGSCHTIGGIPGAHGKVGPVLDASLTQRSMIAGKLTNSPQNLMTWIMDPQGVTPGTDMPNLDVTESAARDIAAYLYSLR